MIQIFAKVQKPYFLAIFGPFFPIFEKMRIFQKITAVTFLRLWSLNFMQKIRKKLNEPILRTLRHGRTDGRTDDTEFIGPSRCKHGSKNEQHERTN